jgi:hypothetical protein
MSKIDDLLCPLISQEVQTYLGTGLHTLGLIEWILRQTGPAHIVVTTFSTSIEFLSGFYNLRKRGLILSALMIADLKASKKTYKLDMLMQNCFDVIYLAENHSKIVIVENDSFKISVISSQNNTYGGRSECTLITTNTTVYNSLKVGIDKLTNNSLRINGRKGRDN